MVPNKRILQLLLLGLVDRFPQTLLTGLGTVGVGGGTEASCVRDTQGNKAWGLISAE